MSQGYIILASSRDRDSLTQAHALAMTIKQSDDEREICVLVDKLSMITDEYTAFDYTMELPYGDYDVTESDININLWQIFYATPFDDTLYIDRRSIVTCDINRMWNACEYVDFAMPEHALTYRLDVANYATKFKTHEANKIPSNHADVIYFKQSVVASEVFKMADVVFKYWREIYKQYVTEYNPGRFDTNILMNLAVALSGNENVSVDDLTYIDTDLDCIEHIGEESVEYDWTEYLSVWYYKHILKISNYRVDGIVNYGNSGFLTEEIYDGISISYNNTRYSHA